MKKFTASTFTVDGNKKTKAGNIFSEIFAIYSNYKPETLLCILGLGSFCVLFKYFDGTSLQAWALETGDAFFRGGYSRFNEILSQNLWGAPHGTVNGVFLISNLLFAIWNLPVLFIHYIFKTGYIITHLTRMWGQLFFVLLVVLCGYILNKITSEISHNPKNGMISAVLFWSSLSVAISVGFAMQDEIIYIFFILMGIHNAILDKKNISLIWLAAACCTCPIMLLFAIPIVLFSSEKLAGTICRVLVLFSATVLQLQYITTLRLDIGAEDEIKRIFEASVITLGGIGNISIFAIIVILAYMSLWSIKCDGTEQKIRYLFWHLTILSVAMFVLGLILFYRVIICIPFIIMNITILDNTKKINAIFALLLSEIMKTWIGIFGVWQNSFVYLPYFPSRVKRFFGLDSYSDAMGSILRLIFPQISNTMTIAGGFIVALGIWLVYICHPKHKREILCPINIRAMLVTWSSVPLVFVLLVCTFLFKVNILNLPLQVDTQNPENAKITYPIDGTNYVEEYYCGKGANNLLITVIPYGGEKAYPFGQTLTLDIVDAESGETLASKSYNASAIKSGAAITYRVEDVKIKKNHWYKFKFYSPDLIENEEHYMRLFRSVEGSANPQRHYANDFSDAVNFDIISKLITY